MIFTRKYAKVLEVKDCHCHGYEMVVEDPHGIQYLCLPDQLLEDAHRCQAGSGVWIMDGDGRFPYYIQPAIV